MKIWAVSNQKGGVGKTTTVASLGGLLSVWGFRTLLIDLDPHGSLTSYFKLNPDEVELGVYNLFRDASEKKKDVHPKYLYCRYRIRRHIPVARQHRHRHADRQVATMGGMGLVISTALHKVADRYDYVLIDSPPMLGVLMINALAACDRLIIPVLAEFLALKGLDRMVHTLRMVFHSRKTPPKFIIVPTIYDKRTKASKDSLAGFARELSRKMSGVNVIPVDTRVRDASAAGTPLPLFDKNAKAVEAYTELLEQLLLDKG